MLSKYGIVCEVARSGSFSYVAGKYGYVQSTVSQIVKNLESELGVTLIDRKSRPITWSADGLKFRPYLTAIYQAETALARRKSEMDDLQNETIRIGCFTSVSRETLPALMVAFKKSFPSVRFEIYQGNYDDIEEWLKSGFVDLGFISQRQAGSLDAAFLYEDEMVAVLPLDHPLNEFAEVSLADLAAEPFILMDEGKENTAQNAFAAAGCLLRPEYVMYDDYSILSMVKKGLGVSMLFRQVAADYAREVSIRTISTPVLRSICLACRDRASLPKAASRFAAFTVESLARPAGSASGAPVRPRG